MFLNTLAFLMFSWLIYPLQTYAQSPVDQIEAANIYTQAIDSYEAGDCPQTLLLLEQSAANLQGKTNPDLEYLNIQCLYKIKNYSAAYKAVDAFFHEPKWQDNLSEYNGIVSYDKRADIIYEVELEKLLTALESWQQQEHPIDPVALAQKLAKRFEKRLKKWILTSHKKTQKVEYDNTQNNAERFDSKTGVHIILKAKLSDMLTTYDSQSEAFKLRLARHYSGEEINYPGKSCDDCDNDVFTRAIDFPKEYNFQINLDYAPKQLLVDINYLNPNVKMNDIINYLNLIDQVSYRFIASLTQQQYPLNLTKNEAMAVQQNPKQFKQALLQVFAPTIEQPLSEQAL